jgi:hypothetical protein
VAEAEEAEEAEEQEEQEEQEEAEKNKKKKKKEKKKKEKGLSWKPSGSPRHLAPLAFKLVVRQSSFFCCCFSPLQPCRDQALAVDVNHTVDEWKLHFPYLLRELELRHTRRHCHQMHCCYLTAQGMRQVVLEVNRPVHALGGAVQCSLL